MNIKKLAELGAERDGVTRKIELLERQLKYVGEVCCRITRSHTTVYCKIAADSGDEFLAVILDGYKLKLAAIDAEIEALVKEESCP